jgi:serine protease Do
VQIQPVTKDLAESLGLQKAEGALVAEPQADSPAAKADIKAGDVITKVNGEKIEDARDLAKRIGAMAPNAKVDLTVVRDGKERNMSLTLGTLPNTQEARADRPKDDDEYGGDTSLGKLGLTLAPADRVQGSGGEGVVVTEVDRAGVAAEHGFASGDIILEVGGEKVKTPSDVRKQITDARSGGKRTILMRVKKGERSRFVALPVGRS